MDKKKDLMKNNLQYYTNLKISELKTKGLYHRRAIIERQKMLNYHNELDRLRGELSKPLFSRTATELIKRRDQLEKLGAKATDGIK